MKRLGILSAVLAAPTLAHASAFEAKTMRENDNGREVERPLLVGKGWVELGVGSDIKSGTGTWSDDGEIDEFEDASWLYTTQSLNIRYGIARRAELYWNIKTHYVRLQNDALETDNSQFGWGDPEFGWNYELYRSMAPTTSIIAGLAYKAPFANEAPGNMVGAANSFERFVLTTGTPDVTGLVRAKRQVGPFALTGGVAYVHRMGGVVMYLTETSEGQFNARIQPGDLTQVDADVLLQVGPVALHAGAMYTLRGTTRVGTSTGGLFPNTNLQPIDGSDGWALDLNPGLVFNATRGVDVDLDMTMPLRGEDAQFFPIEDLHPTYGTTYSATLELRY